MNPIFFGQTVLIITVTLFGKQKLFQWLYSESPVKNKIVLNDRWAKFTDGKKHGDYYTREYSNRNMPEDKPLGRMSVHGILSLIIKMKI